MNINQTLTDLEKITDFSLGKNDPRNGLQICKGCPLLKNINRNVAYSASFYKDVVNKFSPIPIIFVSRDPNINPAQVRSENVVNIVSQWYPPKKQGLGWFFSDFLMHNGLWLDFINYLKYLLSSSSLPSKLKFYWTHLVKCYTQNKVENVNLAKGICKNYLLAEITRLKPKLIIAAGNDVFDTLSQIGGGGIPVIKIPHPSRAPYQRWKKNKLTSYKISFDELKQKINSII